MEERSFRGIKQWRGGASGELKKNGEEELQGNETVIKQWRRGASGV